MIPKIIHYCWFGNGEKPESFKTWLDSWTYYLSDYEIIEWNESNFDAMEFKYAREALRTRNYAHLSDVCRIYALWKYGGVYLDVDVEICKNLDSYLFARNGVVGMETEELIGTGLMMSEPGSVWTKMMLDYYSKKHFINIFGHPNRKPNTVILTKELMPKLERKHQPLILHPNYIVGVDRRDVAMIYTETIAVHHYNASWKCKKTIKTKVKNLIQGFRSRYLDNN